MLRLILPLAALALAGCTSTVGLFTAERTGNQTLQDVNATMARRPPARVRTRRLPISSARHRPGTTERDS